MDEKIIKSVVFDNKTVINSTSEQPVDVDFTLPEYYPDIARILKCNCVPFITSKGINGSTLWSEGTAVVTVLYVDNDNMLNSYEYRYNFSKNFDLKSDENIYCACVTAKTDYMNCRAVTASKIDLHGSVSVTASAVQRIEKEIISDTEIDDIEVLSKSVSANTPLSCNEKNLLIEEEVEIGSAKKDINCIIRYSADAVIKENKLIAGKVMVKGEMCVGILYCNDDGEIEMVKEKIPVSQMIESDTKAEDCGVDVSAQISSLEIKPKSDNEGKLRSFSLNANLLITAAAYCTEDTQVVLDAYSRKYEITAEKTDMSFTSIADNINDDFSNKQTFSFEEVKKIIDLWGQIKGYSSSFEEGRAKAEGTILISILYYDANSVPVYAEREMPFVYEKQTNFASIEYGAEPNITLCGCSYLLSNENEIEVKAELSSNYAVYNCLDMSVLTGITVNTEAAKRKSECAMAVYYAQKGESLWDIARKYLAGLEEIKQINDIEEDVLKTDKTILIPMI